MVKEKIKCILQIQKMGMWSEEIEIPVPEDDGFREVEHETVVDNTDDD